MSHVLVTNNKCNFSAAYLSYHNKINFTSDNVSDFAKGDTALHLAAAQGHEACVNSLLLEYKDNPDLWARNGKDRLPLHVACTRDNGNIVKELIRRNALDKGSRDCLAAVDAFSRTPLQIACLNNNVNVVKYLTDGVKELLPMLDMEVFVNYSTGEHGETALHCAARGGCKEVVDMLIKAGAKTDCVSASKRTPLHVACKRGNLEAATALANWNGDVIGSVDESGKTALMIASAENDSPAIAQMLIGLGAKILVHDHTGKTPVFEAVLHNRVNVLEYLMTQLTSDMIEQDIDKSQNTPLHWAADKGFLICCKILIEKKYKIGQRNKVKGKTPIHYAATEGRTETLKIMLESESKSCRFVDTNGNTPLHDAAQRGQSQCCRILLSNGASINNENARGVTPLHLAAEAGHRTTVKVLLEAGAKFNVPDLNEETPLHYSARAGQEDTAKALINKGANLAKVSQFGDTPLLTAIRNNNENVIALLLQSEQWKEALTVPGTTKSTREPALESEGDAVDTRDIKLNVLSEVGGKKARKEQLINSHPLHQLIIHYPSQARAVFDKCTYVDPDNMVSEEKEDYWVQFDYSVIDDATDGTLHPFNTMLQHDRIDLLDHPLISSVITYKWNSLGKGWCYLNVFLNVIFVIFISTYALMEIAPESTDKREEGILLVLSLCSIGLSGLRLVLELFQLITNTRGYLKDPMNYLEVVIFGLTIVFCLSIIQYPDTHPSYFQWEVGCYVVVFAWYNMLMSLKKLPFIGIYVIMIKILLESFIKVMLPIFLFLIPYILMFHMSFPKTGTFEGVGTTIVKVLTMFTGEINFDMYFVPPSTDTANPVSYPYSTYPLYIFFLFLCPIILMNLLTGLAILDVAETRKTSKLRRSAERIEQIFLAEKIVGKLSFCGVFAVSHYPHGKLYPNKVVYPLSRLFCFGDTIYDFRGSCVVDIVSRRRQIDGDGELRLKKIQGQVIRIITALNQLSAKIDVNTMQIDKNVNSEEIEIRKSRIIDTESGPA